MTRSRAVLRRPARRLTQAELDSFLERAADILRGNVDHSEFRGYVFALLFFKRISDVYKEELLKLTADLGDPELAKNPRLHNFVVPGECLWEDVARKPRNELGVALNETMIAIERANQPNFDGILTNKVDFNKSDELPREKLINLINHFSSQVFDRAHVSDDVFGNAYEYLIRNFASKAGKSSGEFYTPREVAYLMAEMIEPDPDHTVCDWASGSGGLLLQCRNYVRRRRSIEEADRLSLFGQESNVTTHNISRINLILHGVKSWKHERGDSLRDPRFLGPRKQLLEFDRIVMNPPFSLEDWGYDEFAAGDPYNRFEFGLPPRENGDYAWLQHVVKALKPEGKAIIVMSQGVLFRGQPEQTEDGDGRNQKADTEYLIREGFISANLIECVVVLPPKLFYGNSVPGCLIVLNKNKPADRQGRVLLIWASRNFQKANPQNLLRPSDLMRILVPWRAFGDLTQCRRLVSDYEDRLVAEERLELERRMVDIADAFDPLIKPLFKTKADLAFLVDASFKTWLQAPDKAHPFFGHLLALMPGGKFRVAAADAKAAYLERVRFLIREVRNLESVQLERTEQERQVNKHFEREIEHIREAAADLLRICSDPKEAARYFVVAESAEILANEFNLNLPRFVDIFDADETPGLEETLNALNTATGEYQTAEATLNAVLERLSVPGQ